MKAVSILIHGLGPGMRGSCSSHTAGAWHIGRMARSILGCQPERCVIAFDPAGSYAATFREQGADRGFAMGLMNRPLTDNSFFSALEDAVANGLDLQFEVRSLENADHPNTTELELSGSDGRVLNLVARSVGGGEVEIVRIDDRPVLFIGSTYESLIELPAGGQGDFLEALRQSGVLLGDPVVEYDTGYVRMTARCRSPLPESFRDIEAAALIWSSAPVYYVQTGNPLFSSASDMVAYAVAQGISLGEAALTYESRLLVFSESDVTAEMLRRYQIMADAVEKGLDPGFTGLQMLEPCAGRIYKAESAGGLSGRSMHTRVAARTLAVLHVNSAMGVVCAAPTGGAAGVIPGVIYTLDKELGISREQVVRALLAAGGIGAVFATRATFAAEVAGCQVEIGAAGAMAAAAVVDACGGSAAQACDAAAIALQNTMGSVCDLLHGTVEIPCHTRNAVAAANAFVNADMIMGGYINPVPLDETIDAVYAVGRAMPPELRCTSRGGLAVCPSAVKIAPLKR